MSSGGIRARLPAPRMRRTLFYCALAAVILSTHALEAQTLKIDLERMSEILSIRYYIAEKGKLPPRYILLGSTYIYPNFLQGEFDTRKSVVEFDEMTGSTIVFHFPGHKRFLRKDEIREGFYYYTQRDLHDPQVGIEVVPEKDYILRIKEQAARKVWLEEVRYGLQRERDEGRAASMLSLDIPIHLPRQIERIIGKGEETNLTVQGREKIRIGGRSDWCAGCPYTEGRPRQQKFPDLDMEQQLSVNLHGNIGEKINVEITHNSQGGAMEAVNRVRINYTGFEDDIIKLIEMGDTDLILSGANLVSYQGGTKGLFGIKGIAQVGPLDLTVIASKEEGETATGSFTALGGRSMQWTVADYDFIKRQFFYFESPGSGFSNANFFVTYPLIDDNDDVEVFVSLRPHEWGQSGVAEYPLKAYADPENNGLDENIASKDKYWPGLFKRLIRDEDYGLIQDYSTEKKYIAIRLFHALETDRALAVRYRGFNESTGLTFTVGDYGEFDADSLTAELICPSGLEFAPPSELPDFPSTWNMMMRNVYSLGSVGLDEDAPLNILIEEEANRLNPDIHEESKISYIRLFGLDRYDRFGNLQKDDIVDDLQEVLNLQQGYIMLPWYEPFNPPPWVIDQFIDREGDTQEAAFEYNTLVRDSLIYNAVLTEPVRREGHHYNLVIESESGQRTFQISAFDIIEGSEAVTVDGVRLSRGIGYDIDYSSGTVTLKSDVLAEMTADSKVDISYQHRPLIGGGRSSLLGVGANLHLMEHSRINGTFLYNSVGAPKYNPRLGEEPGRNIAADLNGSFQFNPGWMTSLVNVLPRVDTDDQSNLNISAEVSVSVPNPNTKGEAFIDDMEGIEDSDVLSLMRRSWNEASPPLDSMTWDKLSSQAQPEFYWYNPSRTDKQDHLITSKRDLNPRLDRRENASVSSLFLHSLEPEAEQWFGVMTGFPGGGLDLTTAQYLEIWVNDFHTDTMTVKRGGVVHVDFGWIDEDFYRPDSNALNDEDKKPYTWIIDEDIGFEGEECSYPLEFNNATWDEAKKVFTGINCRRGNGIHDTEDLNKNGKWETNNAYYTLELRLDEAALIDVQRDFPRDKYTDYWEDQEKGVDVNKKKSWRMYRLDLSRAELISPGGNEPRWDAVQHMRIWVSDPDSLNGLRGNLVEIAGMKFVGNRWEFNGIRDLEGELLPLPVPNQKITIGVINNKDDPTHYRTPYRVEQEEGIENREQSLLLKFENFADSTSFRAVKRFFGGGQNYGNYRELQFFLNSEVESDSCYFYLQIAYDSLNYYELEIPLTSYDKWIWTTVNLSDLTNLKLSAAAEITKTIQDAVNPAQLYTAKLVGTPTLFRVRYLFVGLRNKSAGTIERGEVWFNELRLGGVRRDIDHAERMSVSADLAGIMQIRGDWQRTGPEFRSLRQKQGSGMTKDGLSFSGRTKLGHLMPTFGFDLPISARYTTTRSLPKYIPKSDVEIGDVAVRDSLKSVSTSYSFNFSVNKRGSKNFLMKNIFDNMKASFSYSKRTGSSPTSRDTTSSMSGNLNYQIHFRSRRELSLFKGIKWRYWLSSFSLTSSASRKIGRSYAFTGGRFVKKPLNYDSRMNSNMSIVYEPFESLKFDFTMREKRNLGIDHKFYGVPNGVQTSFGHELRARFQPRSVLLSSLNPVMEYRSNYDEDIRPTLRQTDDPFGTRNVTGRRNINFAFDLDVGDIANRLGKTLHIIKGDEARGRLQGRTGKRYGTRGRKDYKQAVSAKPQVPGEGEGRGPRKLKLDKDMIKKKPAEPSREEPPAAEADEREKGDLESLGVKRPGELVTPKAEDEKEEEGEEKETEQEKPGGGAAAADTAAAPKQDPLLLFKQLIKLLGRIEPIRSNVDLTRNSAYQRLYDRADLMYQLGISDASGALGKSGEEENNPEKIIDNLSLNLRSGLTLSQNIALDFNYGLNKRKDILIDRVSESERVVWPSMTLSWSGMESYRMLQRFIQRSSMNVKFERSTSKNVRGEKINYTFTPNWVLEWKNKLSTNLAFSFRQNTNLEKGQEIWDRSWAITLNLKYAFEGSKGLGIPLPFLSKKKIRFKSTLTTDIKTGYTNTSRINQPSSSTLFVSPQASYRFSNTMKGSLFVNYKRSSGGIFGYVNHSVEVGVTAEFTF